MLDRCKNAINQAAGRILSESELNKIEAGIKDGFVKLRQKDPEAFRSMPDDQKFMEAAKIASEEYLAQAALKRRRVVLQANAKVRLDRSLEAFVDKNGGNKFEALRRMMVQIDDGKGVEGTQNLETRMESIKKDYMVSALEAIDLSSPEILGLFENKQGSDAIIYELFGQDSSQIAPPEIAARAKKAAEAWSKTAEEMRTRFNNLGGEIGKLEDWRMGQKHNKGLILEAGQKKWVSDIFGKVDRKRYLNEDGAPMNDAKLMDFLNASWETIATGGANKGKSGRASSMKARRHAEERVIHFKDAQSYIEYSRQYSGTDTFNTMLHHIGVMSRDIANIEMLGPNPDALMDTTISDILAEESKNEPAKIDKLKGEAVKAQSRYDFLSGKTDPVVNEQLARNFDTLRSWMVATKLGSAFVTSMTDNATLQLTAAVNGMSHIQLLKNQFKAISDANFKSHAIRAGLGMDIFLGNMNRWAAESMSNTIGGKIAGAVMKGSFLEGATNARRMAFGATMMSSIGKSVQKYKRLSTMDKYDRAILESKGVTERNFEVWKLAQLEDWGGGNTTMLTPESIYAIPDESFKGVTGELEGMASREAIDGLKRDAALKLMGHIATETNMAVIMPGVENRLTMMEGLQRGTWKGEIARSFFVFKGFPIAAITKHWNRAFSTGLRGEFGKVYYVAAYLAGTTIMGAAATQIYEMINGRDPLQAFGKPKDVAKFWGASFLKGGALGIYGDFLFQPVSSYGSSLWGNLLGPVAGTAEEAVRLTIGNAQQLAKGEETDIGPEAVRFVKNNTPFQNFWPTRAVTDRLVFNNLQEIANPGYLSRHQRKMEREYGKSYYLPVDPNKSARMPNLGRVVGK